MTYKIKYFKYLFTSALVLCLSSTSLHAMCTCLDNATPYNVDTNSGGDDGQFSELLSLMGANGPLPSWMTWTIVGAMGAFDAFNVPAVGVQSAGVPVASDGSVTLTYNPTLGRYEIPIVHIDALGYTMTIEGPLEVGSPANVSFTVSNLCAYPDPGFNPSVPSVLYTDDAPITLGAFDNNGFGFDQLSFSINGSPASEIEPQVLGVGAYSLIGTFDGQADNNQGISPDGGVTPAFPGCVQELTQDFTISAPLPVEFISFTGKIEDDLLKLDWVVQQEDSKGYFLEVARSIPVWEDVLFVPSDDFKSSASNTFSFSLEINEEHLLKTDNYYRLRQVDLDGTVNYSWPVFVKSDFLPASKIRLFPNPTKNNVTLNFLEDFDNVNISIYNASNGEHMTNIYSGNNTNTQELMLDVSSFSNGLYYLLVKAANGVIVASERFVVQK